MKELVVISGKGGTGKTSIVASFAALARGDVLADCDVDAADLHLILAPDIQHRQDFSGGSEAVIRQDDCIGCEACLSHCRFDAILKIDGAEGPVFSVDPLSCEGCGVCVECCPVDAVDFPQRTSGEWFISETRCGPMVHARLGIAEENSGKLVSMVRKQAVGVAQERGIDRILIDGPPGIGCPVIASIGGASLVLAVTEPTLSGLHDLERVVGLAAHFKVAVMVCINKADINVEVAEKIRSYCTERGLSVAGELPYDPAVTKAQLAGKSIVEYSNGGVSPEITRMWEKVTQAMDVTIRC